MPKLIILSPDGDPRTVELEDSATIGRAPECSVHLDEPGCSRRHCQVLKIASGYEIVDLKSRNGTKVNGVKRNRHVLSDGDVIEIGDTRLTYREREGAEEEVILEDVGHESQVATEGDCYLVYADGDRKGDRIPLAAGRVTFGRKDSNTVTLKDAMASSYHCEITKEGGGYVLRDLGSTNGTVVNGEPVSETTLGHGARVRIGRTRFVFVDPAVADFEQAMAKEEEAEAEWGLMRAQVDMARVKKARRTHLVMTLVFVVIVAGVGFLVWTQPDRFKELFGMKELATIREVPQNRVDPGDYSFESPRGEWTLADEETGDVRVGRNDAHQGTQALLLSGPAEGLATAIAEYGRDFPVVPGNRYEAAAWVKLTGAETLARAGILWISSREASVRRYAFTPFATAGDWNRVAKTVVAPPRAESARLVLAVAGPGAAFFDDVVFRQEEGRGERVVEIEKAGFNLAMTEDGLISVEKTGRFLLWNGGIDLRFADGTARQAFRFVTKSYEPGPSGGTVTGDVLLADGTPVPVRVSVAGEEAGFSVTVALEEDVEGVVAAGLGFAVARDYLSQGATLSGSFEAIEIQSDTTATGAEKAILGGSDDRLSLVAGDEADFRMDTAEDGLRLAFLGLTGKGEQTASLVVDFSSQRNEAQALLNQARGAKNAGRYGEAIRLFSEVVNEYPFATSAQRQAAEEQTKLASEGEERLGRATALFEGAVSFHDLADLREALELARKTAADYEGQEVATNAAALAGKIEKALAKAREKRDQEAADRLEERALDFERREQQRLARVFFSRIVELYPDTPAAERARQKLK